ncbi:MAG: endonuclease III [Coprobacillaceae bacterium]
MNKEKSKIITDYMEELFPNAECELVHSNTFELLVAVMLSAQTTDASVNKLTKTLFKKYKTVEDYANATIEELEKDIRSIGLYRNKAKNLHAMANLLITNFDGVVPSEEKDLESLPGVGHKTANVVRSVAFNIPAFAVDTHVERISKRLGFAKKNDSITVVEKKLNKSIDKEYWNKAHHQFIFFGRYFCKSMNPNCGQCKLITICKEPKRKPFLPK